MQQAAFRKSARFIQFIHADNFSARLATTVNLFSKGNGLIFVGCCVKTKAEIQKAILFDQFWLSDNNITSVVNDHAKHSFKYV